MKTTSKAPFSNLWMFAFLTFPLLGIRYFRLGIGPLTLPIFVVIIFIIVLCYLFKISAKNSKLSLSSNRNLKLFMLSFFLFLLVQIFNSFRSLDFVLVLSQLVRIIIAFLTFFIILIFFPKNRELLRKVIIIAIFSSTAMVLIFIYRYLFFFHAPFLGINWEEVTESGKNQMGLYLSLITPFILWRYIYARLISIWIVPTIIHLFAVFYTLSRGTWVSLFLSLIVVLIIILSRKSKERKRIVYKSIIGFAIIISMSFILYFSKILPQSGVKSFQARVQTLSTLQDYAEGSPVSSIAMRKDFIKDGLDFFSDSPFIGIGTTNFLTLMEHPTHNDYIEILCEQGLIGLIIFLSMLFSLVMKVITIRDNSWEIAGLKQATIAIIIYMIFINAYTTIMIYVIFALLLKLKDKELYFRNIPISIPSVIKMERVLPHKIDLSSKINQGD